MLYRPKSDAPYRCRGEKREEKEGGSLSRGTWEQTTPTCDTWPSTRTAFLGAFDDVPFEAQISRSAPR